MEIIARIENGFREKFGVPRQSGLVPEVISRVVMAEKYSVREAFRGIEDYSHLWLLWEFDRAQQDDWRPTVRPPRLGGNTRLGVFATRSPFRPNRIGLTVVRLIRMEEENGRITLVVSGADLMDGTPIVDIKPYLPDVDSVPDAVGGFSEQTERQRLTVDFRRSSKVRLSRTCPPWWACSRKTRARRISMTESACAAYRMAGGPAHVERHADGGGGRAVPEKEQKK
ncbi:MAG: tRNA (N6-threonylcarbamoyladenosine(37)-N6)-methyltransferase TrmO [Christensenellales bacterium]